jgi:hypothetical protein
MLAIEDANVCIARIVGKLRVHMLEFGEKTGANEYNYDYSLSSRLDRADAVVVRCSNDKGRGLHTSSFTLYQPNMYNR